MPHTSSKAMAMNANRELSGAVPAPGEQQVARRIVTVTNPQGLHLRPAAAFAQLARQFQSQVSVVRVDRTVNGKSQLDLLLLAAEPGTELEVVVVGADADSALRQLAELLASPNCDDE